MSKIIKFILELLRILILLVLVSGVLTKVFITALDRFNIAQMEMLLLGIQVVIIILFGIWYNRRGQYQGWFNTKK